ncbi:serine--tRNA ligase [Anaplasma capra]|uniref:serine--tRNA ligase n=1 Tax=Anaplasma capra TaxID=1562740 RepID=UPI0021D578CE|nr:serine--tRNA ligase [Anaplasma capra]MCU7611579.1 serine--tRNA ligase [Anaplasma capra]MCU7611982.1 serine--tRNA ligase [Anaplasma capra]
MHDIELIRKSPELFDRAMISRGFDKQAENILRLDTKKRKELSELYSLREKRNMVTQEVALLKKKGMECALQIEASKKLAEEIEALERAVKENKELSSLLEGLPNIPDPMVPIGEDENDNVEVKLYGKKREFSFDIKPHYELGETLNLMDFRRAAVLSGSRFSILTGQLAELERALAGFMLDIHTKEFGYTEIAHPLLVNESAMYNVGQLPKFDGDSFSTTNNLRLIPTSEVVLTNLVSGTTVPRDSLPMRFTAYSQCFRAEAGSAGLDTRGMIRQHQFGKVELVSITTESQSSLELDRMTSVAEDVLKRLELPYRVVLLCSGDMGFSASMSYDIEVWMPAQGKYREISSCSNCGDFQARRMGAKYSFFEGNTKRTALVHTLNGSALAIGRTMAAIMENYQNEDSSVTVPDALRKYIGTSTIVRSENALP